MKSSVFKVALPGRDVSSTDPNDFTIHSRYNTLKVFLEGYGTVEIEPGVGLYPVTIHHGLGYKPLVWAYAMDPDDLRWRLMNSQRLIVGGFNAGWQYTDGTLVGGEYVESDNDITFFLYYDLGEPATNKIAHYKYYIFLDPRQGAWYE